MSLSSDVASSEAPTSTDNLATVAVATAKLWTAQNPQEIVVGLRELHEALLLQDDEDDPSGISFDPSDVWVAIQAASLRGLEREIHAGRETSSTDNTTDSPDSTIECQWLVLQESLWAIAALTRVCVGPAWWCQILQRRRFRRPDRTLPRHRQITPTTLAEDEYSYLEDTDGASSSSEETVDPQSDGTTSHHSQWPYAVTTHAYYPHIPDILPAALLRFSANAIEKALLLSSSSSSSAFSTEQQIKLVEAQLCIILQICCAHHSAMGYYDRDFYSDWYIPGAHETVGMVLAFSLKLVCTGRQHGQEDLLAFLVVAGEAQQGSSNTDNNNKVTKTMSSGQAKKAAGLTSTGLPATPSRNVSNEQWKYILLIVRATTDLISSGWRPLRWGRDGHDVVVSLLVVACRGIKLDDLQASTEDFSTDARQERLMASSCAAEALSALLALAQRGLIPLDLQNMVVRTGCRLHALLSDSIDRGSNLLYPLFDHHGLPNTLPATESNEEGDIDHQMEFFTSQRELCLHDTSALLWAMLANETSVESTITVLFEKMEAATHAIGDNDSVDSPLFNNLKWNDPTEDYLLQDCSSVVRVLRSGLWGVAPDLSELSTSLRIFWLPAIQALCQLLSTIHSKVVADSQTTSDKESDHEKQQQRPGVLSLVRSSYFTKQVRPLVIDALDALETVVVAELRGGNGILSAVDWDAVVDGVETAIIPWLWWYSVESISPGEGLTNESTNKDTNMKAEALLIRFSQLLEHYVSTTNAPLMAYASLRRFLLLLLHNTAALDKNKAELVSLSVFRAWAKFGFFPFRLEGWRSTASELLNEAFATGKRGSFKHSYAVRLEALESLTFEADGVNRTEGSLSSTHSLLVMTRNLQDCYQDIVTESVLPVLRLILINSHGRGDLPKPSLCTDDNSTPEPREFVAVDDGVCSDPTRSTSAAEGCSLGERDSETATELQLFAVKLAGRLFRDTAGNRRHRTVCVTILRSAACSGPDSAAVVAPVRNEALNQLGQCLSRIFDDHFAHESIQALADALCFVLVSAMDSVIRKDHVVENLTLAISGIKLLGRLELNATGGLAWLAVPMQRPTAECASPSVRVAALVTVRDDSLSGSTTERTIFSFKGTTATLIRVIRMSKMEITEASDQSLAMLSNLRRLAFDVLNGFLRAGVSVEINGNVHDLAPASNSDHDEVLSTFKCLAGLVQLAFAVGSRKENGSGPPTPMAYIGLNRVFSDRRLAIRSFRCLFALLPYLEKSTAGVAAREAYNGVVGRLEVESIAVSVNAVHARLVATLLFILTEASSTWELIGVHQTTLRTFAACCHILAKTVLSPDLYILRVALRCAISTVRKFTAEETTLARQKFEISYKSYCEEQVAGDPSEGVLALMVLREALEQPSNQPTGSSDCDEGIWTAALRKKLSRHEQLSIECACLEKFEAAEGDDASIGAPHAAWLCDNNAILTCRVGSPTSRYRGYVEVVIRSPLTFRRGLIPTGKLALPDPDFPLLLPHGPKPSLCEIQDEREHHDGLGQFLIKRVSSKVLDRANSVLERFDAMFDALSSEVDPAINILEGTENEASSSTPVDEETLSFAPEGADSTSATEATMQTRSEPICWNSVAANVISGHKQCVVDPCSLGVKDWFVSAFNGCEAGCDNLQNQVQNHLLSHDFRISTCDDRLAFKNFHFRDSKRLLYNANLERAIGILDRTTPSNVYKFGLLYLGPRGGGSEEQTTLEARLLSTIRCSPAFHRFASQLGELTPTRYLKHYSAGLDTSEFESDGRYALAWSPQDGDSTVVFHVAYLMPPGLNERKRHIGNDNVLIVYQSMASDDGTNGAPIVSGHFGHATIVIKPVAKAGIFLVSCHIRAGLPSGLNEVLSDFAGEDLLAEIHAANFVRSLAMRIDLACRTMMENLSPPTNSLERARQLAEMRRYVMDSKS